MTAPRRTAARFAGLLLALVAAGAAGEILARLTPRRVAEARPNFSGLRHVTTVPSRHMLKPDQVWEGWWHGGGAGAALSYRINHAGYRGPQIAVPKPAGILRVVILGDSSVFDPAVGEGEDWPARVQETLRTRGYRQVEIVNAGVPEHATLDSLGRLYTQIWTFQPDFVLIDQAWSDIVSFVDLTPRRPAFWAFQPYDRARDPLQPADGALDRILDHSQLYQRLRPRPAPALAEKAGARNENLQDHYDRTGVEQYRLALGLLVEGTREIGARPVLVIQPTLVSESNGAAERGKIDYSPACLTHAALAAAFRDCAEAVREVGRRKGVAVIDAQAILGGKPELFEDQVHLTRSGGREMADLVAGSLAETLGAPALPPPLQEPEEHEISRADKGKHP